MREEDLAPQQATVEPAVDGSMVAESPDDSEDASVLPFRIPDQHRRSA